MNNFWSIEPTNIGMLILDLSVNARAKRRTLQVNIIKVKIQENKNNKHDFSLSFIQLVANDDLLCIDRFGHGVRSASNSIGLVAQFGTTVL